MKALKLSSILASVAQLTGVSSRQISPEQHIAMVVAVSEGLKNIWNEYPWPELCDTQPYYLWPNEWDTTAALISGATVRLTRGETTSYFTRLKPKDAATLSAAAWALGAVVSSSTWGVAAYRAILLPAVTSASVKVNDRLAVNAGTYITGHYRVMQIIEGTTNRTIVIDTGGSGISNGTLMVLPYYPGATEVSTEWTSAVMDTYITLPATIGKVLDAWDADPNLPDSYASRIDYELEGDKVRVPQDVPCVWLQTHAVELELDGTYWLATESATVGMVRYSGTAGDCYKCIVALTGSGANPAPESDATHWTRVQIPALLAPATKYLASADLLRADGKETTALAREAKATNELQRALQSVNEHQHQTARWGVTI